MAEQVFEWNRGAMQGNLALLGDNPYPGRFIGLGLSESGEHDVQVYAVMGRSDPSRNRTLEFEPDPVSGNTLVRTDIFDQKQLKKGDDLSLIVYNAMRQSNNGPNGEDIHVVSNGHQTNVVIDDFAVAAVPPQSDYYQEIRPIFAHALTSGTFKPKESNVTAFEPDGPNFTPRITAYTALLRTGMTEYGWAITRRDPFTGTPVQTFGGATLDQLPEGSALAFHTYDGDGNPLPSFTGYPYPISLNGNTPTETAEALWEASMDKANRVAMAVKYINRVSGEVGLKIINALQEEVDSEQGKITRLISLMLDDVAPIKDEMPADIKEAIDVERQSLVLRSGWNTCSLGELEITYLESSGRKLPYRNSGPDF